MSRKRCVTSPKTAAKETIFQDDFLQIPKSATKWGGGYVLTMTVTTEIETFLIELQWKDGTIQQENI